MELMLISICKHISEWKEAKTEKRLHKEHSFIFIPFKNVKLLFFPRQLWSGRKPITLPKYTVWKIDDWMKFSIQFKNSFECIIECCHTKMIKCFNKWARISESEVEWDFISIGKWMVSQSDYIFVVFVTFLFFASFFLHHFDESDSENVLFVAWAQFNRFRWRSFDSNIFKCAKNIHKVPLHSLNACMIIVSVIYLHDVFFPSFFASSLSLSHLACLLCSKCCGCEIFNSWPQKKSRTQKKRTFERRTGL